MHKENFFIRNVKYQVSDGLYVDDELEVDVETSANTKNFSEKWKKFYQSNNRKNYDEFQEKWFKSLYGKTRIDLLSEMKSGSVILDAGCGGGDKTQNMAIKSPQIEFWGADLSSELGSKAYEARHVKNVKYIKADIANLPFREESFDLVICDQVLHHTKDPRGTLKEFNRILKKGGTLLTYVYRKKPLPRELLDQHFIDANNYSMVQLFEMSSQLTVLGELLQKKFPEEIDFPAINLLGIENQKKTLQRYIYDNFLKCFYNEEIGAEQSTIINFDWYVPNIAFRFTQEEFMTMCESSGFNIEYMHSESSCLSGRFKKAKWF